MRYWLTTQYPKLEDGSEHYPLRVWLQDGKEDVGALLDKGDLVLIYESKGGLARRVSGASGIKRKVQVARGRQGIIVIAKVEAKFAPDSNIEVFEYEDGSKKWWCWHAPLYLFRSNGYVPRHEVNRVLGYKPKYVFHGFGTRSSGLKEISASEYEALEKIFIANAQHGRDE